MMHRMTLVAAAVATAVVPLAPLYCSGDDAAAMACCAEQAATCNQPTAPDDECCSDAPVEGQIVSASGALKTILPALSAAADAGRLIAAAARRPLAAPSSGWLGLAPDRPPRPLSVLRI